MALAHVRLITDVIRELEREADRLEWDENDLEASGRMRAKLADLRRQRDEGEHWYPLF